MYHTIHNAVLGAFLRTVQHSGVTFRYNICLRLAEQAYNSYCHLVDNWNPWLPRVTHKLFLWAFYALGLITRSFTILLSP